MPLKDQIFHIKEHFLEHLIGYDFENYSDSRDKIDCLVGGNFYWEASLLRRLQENRLGQLVWSPT